MLPEIVISRVDASPSETPDEVVLVVAGTVDLSSAPELVEAGLRELRQVPARALVMDLSEVTFMDSSGLSALVQLRNEAVERGTRVSLRAPSSRVLRLLEVTGLTPYFDSAPQADSR